MRYGFALILISTFLLAGTSNADIPKHATKYSSVSVHGSSASELLTSLKQRMPAVGGKAVYGRTEMSYAINPTFLQGQNTCRFGSLNDKAVFKITLPNLTPASRVEGKTLVAWARFTGFLKQHENTHRQIWLSCLADHRKTLSTMSASSCSKLKSLADQLWSRNQAVCRNKHIAFDAAERIRALGQPLIRMAKTRQ
jgi:predicted secreted Zn-dependent protease